MHIIEVFGAIISKFGKIGAVNSFAKNDYKQLPIEGKFNRQTGYGSKTFWYDSFQPNTNNNNGDLYIESKKHCTDTWNKLSPKFRQTEESPYKKIIDEAKKNYYAQNLKWPQRIIKIWYEEVNRLLTDEYYHSKSFQFAAQIGQMPMVMQDTQWIDVNKWCDRDPINTEFSTKAVRVDGVTNAQVCNYISIYILTPFSFIFKLHICSYSDSIYIRHI